MPTRQGRARGEVPVSVQMHEAPGLVRQLRETCHDMREPVAGVLALTAAALDEPGLPATARARLEQIGGQAEWLAEMIRGFLHETVEAGEEDETGEIRREDTGGAANCPDAARVVNEVIKAGRPTWLCDLSVTTPARPVRCTLQPLLLRRIVSNVLSNAARAAGPSGLVTVHLWRSNGAARLVVDDSGPGFGNIPTGLGLGLAWVVRTIVTHGGRIECGRVAGGGARVSLWLP